MGLHKFLLVILAYVLLLSIGPADSGETTLETPLNQGYGSLEYAIYSATSPGGYPSLAVYEIIDGEGVFYQFVTFQDLYRFMFAATPTENTVVMDVGSMTLWALDTGEFQFNIPTDDGKQAVFIFDGLPVSDSYGYWIE